MTAPNRKLVYGLEPTIAVVALVVASIDAVIIPLSLFSPLLPSALLRMIAIASGSVASLVFLRMLFSPQIHYAIDRANDAMSEGQWLRSKPKKLTDQEWGLTGAKMGKGYLIPLRLVLMVEFLAVVFLAREQWTSLLAFSGAALPIMLTLSQLTAHFPRPTELPPLTHC